jgi:hypothetical protein
MPLIEGTLQPHANGTAAPQAAAPPPGIAEAQELVHVCEAVTASAEGTLGECAAALDARESQLADARRMVESSAAAFDADESLSHAAALHAARRNLEGVELLVAKARERRDAAQRSASTAREALERAKREVFLAERRRDADLSRFVETVGPRAARIVDALASIMGELGAIAALVADANAAARDCGLVPIDNTPIAGAMISPLADCGGRLGEGTARQLRHALGDRQHTLETMAPSVAGALLVALTGRIGEPPMSLEQLRALAARWQLARSYAEIAADDEAKTRAAYEEQRRADASRPQPARPQPPPTPWRPASAYDVFEQVAADATRAARDAARDADVRQHRHDGEGPPVRPWKHEGHGVQAYSEDVPELPNGARRP